MAVLIELALGPDVAEQRRRSDDDFLRARIGGSLACSSIGGRDAGLDRERPARQTQHGYAQTELTG